MLDKNILEKSPQPNQSICYGIGDWLVYPNHNKLSQVADPSNHKIIEPRSMRLLVLLLENAGRTVTKDEIADKIWDGIVSDDAIVATVARLRRALGETASQARCIQTIPTRGYKIPKTIPFDPIKSSLPTPFRVSRWVFVISVVVAFAILTSIVFTGAPQKFIAPEIERARHLLTLGEPDAIERAELLLTNYAQEKGDSEAWLSLSDIYAGKNARLLGYTLEDAKVLFDKCLTNAERAGADLHQLALRKASFSFFVDHEPQKARNELARTKEQSEERANLSILLLAHARKWDEAHRLLESSIQKYPNSNRLIDTQKFVAYLEGNIEKAIEIQSASVTWAKGAPWIDALIYDLSGQDDLARLSWLRFYSNRPGYEEAAPYYETSARQDFAAFIDIIDKHNGANCLDRAIAFAMMGNANDVKTELEACIQNRHALSIWVHHMPLFIPHTPVRRAQD